MQAVKNEGYLAQMQGKKITDNPYAQGTEPWYSAWRQGFIEAFNDSH